MKKILSIFALTVCMTMIGIDASAFGPGFDPDVPPYAAPIDEGLGILAVIGLAYGAWAYKKREATA
ncbi:MAG: hypothetical protein J0L80_08220 [Chitinophagales bacterium]|nr:hypothetical protein [Chitinophagales bacterium]